MPNPFKRRGSAYLPPDWSAPGIGLLKFLAEEPMDVAENFAFVGDIGSGKTTALSAYRQRLSGRRAKDIILHFDVGAMDPEDTLILYRRLHLDLTDALGEDLYDDVAKKLRIPVRSDDGRLASDQIYDLLGALIRGAEARGTRVHLLADECQRPAEQFNATRGRAPSEIQQALVPSFRTQHDKDGEQRLEDLEKVSPSSDAGQAKPAAMTSSPRASRDENAGRRYS